MVRNRTQYVLQIVNGCSKSKQIFTKAQIPLWIIRIFGFTVKSDLVVTTVLLRMSQAHALHRSAS